MNSLATTNFINLKEWLTLPDAANHLSNLLNDKVTEADILQLALSNKLTLSVNFLNDTTAISSNVITYSKSNLVADIAQGVFPAPLNCKTTPKGGIKRTRLKNEMEQNWEKIEGSEPDIEELGKFAFHEECDTLEKLMLELVIDGLKTDQEDTFLIDDGYKPLKAGMWDLSMLGTEWLEVKRRYNCLSGIGSKEMEVLKQARRSAGVVLKDPEGLMLKVQRQTEHAGQQPDEDNEYEEDLPYDYKEFYDDFPQRDEPKVVISDLFCNDWEYDAHLGYQPNSIVQIGKLKDAIDGIFCNDPGCYPFQYIFFEAVKKRMSIWQSFAGIDRFSSENFIPMDYLPEDSELVIRSKALEKFVSSINIIPLGNNPKPLKVKRGNDFNICITNVFNEFTDANGYEPTTVIEVINRMKYASPPLGTIVEFRDNLIFINEKSKPQKNVERAILNLIVSRIPKIKC